MIDSTIILFRIVFNEISSLSYLYCYTIHPTIFSGMRTFLVLDSLEIIYAFSRISRLLSDCLSTMGGTDRTTLVSDTISLHHLIDMIVSSIDTLIRLLSCKSKIKIS
eukprot:TRINITY_DN28705_c0_g1_i1.p1 TRINITY_DN28705_c0_g1~~TRINITY_DN28705_c0_g1_i1.p1  ORF type:complete len:107 (-),score=0.43 TRINITY_DN28705_c0_g1_i1:107-427(-)